MKPGRLQNALKSFGRASKCFKTLWPGSKIHGILGNVGSGAPKNCKIIENPKNVIFPPQNRKKFDHWDGKIGSQLPLKKKKRFCSQVSSSGWHFRIRCVLEGGEQSSFGKLAKNNTNITNTWESRKLKKSIKIKGNK